MAANLFYQISTFDLPKQDRPELEGGHFETFGSVYSTLSWVCFGIGLLLNIYLMLLIHKRRESEMKVYRSILFQMCLLDLYSLTVSAFVQPVYIMLEGSVVMLQNGPFRAMGQPWNFILAEMWVFGYYFSIVSIVVQFVYRYLIVCKQHVMTTNRHVAMLLAGAVFVLGYNLALYFIMYPRRELTETMKSAIHGYFDYGRLPEAHVQISMHGKPDSFRCFIICIYTVSMEIVCYASIIWCGLMIRRSVQKATFEHCGYFRAAERSREVTVTLTLQAVLPLAALLIGAFCILVCVSAYTVGTYLSFYFISYMTIHVPWVPVLNPFITLMVIKPYRNVILGVHKASVSQGTNSRRLTATTRPKTSVARA